MATKDKLDDKGVTIENSLCTRCGKKDEYVSHLFFTCVCVI